MHAFATALAIGLALLAVACAVDVRRDRSALRRMLAAQAGTPDPADGAPSSPGFVDAAHLGPEAPPPLDPAEHDTIVAWQQRATRVGSRLATDDLATRSQPPTAILHDALVLCAPDGLATMRELMPVAGRAVRAGRPLLVAAPTIADDVLETLRVNLRAGRLTSCAVLADAGACADLARATDAHEVSRTHLQAGGIPTGALGTAPRVVATADGTWVGPAN